MMWEEKERPFGVRGLLAGKLSKGLKFTSAAKLLAIAAQHAFSHTFVRLLVPQLMPAFPLVMVVDPSEIDQVIIRKLMESSGFAERVVPFSEGASALEYLNDHAGLPLRLPSMLFVDSRPGDMDLGNFISQFNELPEIVRQRCKIAVMSGFVTVAELDIAASSPYVIRYFCKPLQARYLDALMATQEA